MENLRFELIIFYIIVRERTIKKEWFGKKRLYLSFSEEFIGDRAVAGRLSDATENQRTAQFDRHQII